MKKLYLPLFFIYSCLSILNAQTVQLGSGTTSTGGSGGTTAHPISNYFEFIHFQTVYTKAEINAAGVSAGGKLITSLGWYVVTPPGAVLRNYNVRLGHTTATDASADIVAPLTTCYTNAAYAPTSGGFDMLNFSTPFIWNGTDNIVVDVCLGVADFVSPYGEVRTYAATTSNGSRRIRDDGSGSLCSEPTTTTNNFKPQAQMIFTAIPSCFQPTGLAVSSIGITTASLNWVAPSGSPVSYQWEVRSSGAAGSGATGLAASGSTTNPTVTANATGLTGNTAYTLYVRANCGGTDYSAWAYTTFKTLCSAVSLPYTVDFNTASVPELPSCLTKEDVNTDGYSWVTFTPNPPTATIPSTLVRYEYNSNSDADDWLYTAGLNLLAGTTYQLKFKYKASDGPTYVEQLEVKFGTTAAATGMTSSAIFSNTNIASTLTDPYADANVTFTVPTDGIYYIGFHAMSDADQAYLYVDDINVQVLPTCDQPTNITPSAITPTTATVSWTAPTIGTITNYSWEVRTSGAAGSGATGLVNSGTTATTSVNLTSLPSGATLTFYVKTICTNPDVSTYNSAVFATPAQPPVNDDFCSAITLTLNGTVDCENTIAATATNDPTYSNSTPNNTTWYKYTPTTAGAATVTFTRPAGAAALDCLDGWLAIYTATGSCPSLTFTEVTSTISYDLTSSSNVVVTTPSLAAGTTYYFMVDGVAGAFGKYCIQVTSPLPVSITSFKGERQGANNLLSWTTATETNNTGFELQRSTDGTNFSQLAFVASKASNGNSNANLTYAFTDTKSLIAGSYYRLKQVDRDGKSTLSQVVFIKGVKVSKLELVSIYPNPAIDKLNIALVSPKADNVTFVVSDLSGKVIIKQTASVNNGDNNINVNVSNLAKGTYTIKAICADGCETAISKFVKQ